MAQFNPSQPSLTIPLPVAETHGTTTTTNFFERAAGVVLRYGLVGILLWYGTFKFTRFEAEGIQPLVAHSPFMGWLYNLLSVQMVSNLIGTAEIVFALLLAARPLSARAAFVGSVGAVVMFLSTLSFLWSTPGAFEFHQGFWVPSGTGGFLIKDVFLLGAALWSAGEALRAVQAGRK